MDLWPIAAIAVVVVVVVAIAVVAMAGLPAVAAYAVLDPVFRHYSHTYPYYITATFL